MATGRLDTGRFDHKSDEHAYLLALLNINGMECTNSQEDQDYIFFTSPATKDVVIAKLGFIPNLRFLVDNIYRVERDEMARQFAQDKRDFLIHFFCNYMFALAEDKFSRDLSLLITTFSALLKNSPELESYQIFQLYPNAIDIRYCGIEYPSDLSRRQTPAVATKIIVDPLFLSLGDEKDQNNYNMAAQLHAGRGRSPLSKEAKRYINTRWVYYHFHSVETVAWLSCQERIRNQSTQSIIVELLNPYFIPDLSRIVLAYAVENYLPLLRECLQALPYDPGRVPHAPLPKTRLVDDEKETIRSIDLKTMLAATQILAANVAEVPKSRYSFFPSATTTAMTTTTPRSTM